MITAMNSPLATFLLLVLFTSCCCAQTGSQYASSKADNSDLKRGVVAPTIEAERARLNAELNRLWKERESHPDSPFLTEAIALTRRKTSAGLMTNESLMKFESLAPRLVETKEIAEVLWLVPEEQRRLFADLLFETIRKLAPKAGSPFDPRYEKAIDVGENIDPKRLAPLVFEHLAFAPPYEYPDFELPGGWGDATLAHHYLRGLQGRMAVIIVRHGDSELMESYRNQLNSVSPQLQRVMVWALSRSRDPQNFEVLWKFHSQARPPALADTAKRAMNVIVQSLERSTDMKATNRSGMSSDELKSKAKALRERLQDAKLITEVTIRD